MTSNWETVRLGDVLRQTQRPQRVESLVNVPFAGVRWYAEGVYHRDTQPSEDVKTKMLNLIELDDIVYNRMWATKASFGRVKKDSAGCMVTNDFPIFVVDPSRALVSFVEIFFKFPPFQQAAAIAATGTTERRRLHERNFVELEIALPSLPEQRRIVDLMGSLDDAIEAAEAASSLVENAYLAISQSLQGSLVVMADLLASIESGKSPSGIERTPLADERAVLKISAIGKYGFEPSQVKVVPESTVLPVSMAVAKGDILMVRANGVLSRVGAVCRVEQEYPNLYLCDKTLRLNFDNTKIDDEWALAWLHSPAGRDQIESATTGSDMRNISQRAIKALIVPVPSISDQKSLADALRAIREEASSRRTHSASLRKLRGELLTSLFSGSHTIPESYDAVMSVAEPRN